MTEKEHIITNVDNTGKAPSSLFSEKMNYREYSGMKQKEIEYRTIKHIIMILATMCAANPVKIINLLTGYLWDEEEAGEIKSILDNP